MAPNRRNPPGDRGLRAYAASFLVHDGVTIASSSLLASIRKTLSPDPPHFHHGLLAGRGGILTAQQNERSPGARCERSSMSLEGLERTFQPAFFVRGGHRQTMWANYAPRASSAAALARVAEPTQLPTPDGDRLRVHWNRVKPAAPAVLVVLHGLTGCAASPQVVGIAAKGLERGFDVVRVDLRNASGDTPSTEIGHAGRSEDVRAVLDHVIDRAPRAAICVIGYSLGGNIALKALGELHRNAPEQLRGVATISVPIDLDAACRRIDAATNFVYRAYFVRRLLSVVAQRAKRVPERYEQINLDGVHTIRGFDEAVVAPLGGFGNAADYYQRCSALRFIEAIRVPTLLIQARDDPFIPFDAYRDPRIGSNDAVTLLATALGGHAGFYGSSRRDRDAFWAENRAVDFCAAAADLA